MIFDLFYLYYYPLYAHPEAEPARVAEAEAEQRYRDLVLVVRDGVPVRKLTAIGIDPEPLIDRMSAEGVIGADLKPLHPVYLTNLDEEVEALDDATIRLFASFPPDADPGL